MNMTNSLYSELFRPKIFPFTFPSLPASRNQLKLWQCFGLAVVATDFRPMTVQDVKGAAVDTIDAQPVSLALSITVAQLHPR